jgi:hypothetical protein
MANKINLGPLKDNKPDLRMALHIGRQNGSLDTPEEQDWAARMQPNTNQYLKDYGVQGPYYSEFYARVSDIYVVEGDDAGDQFFDDNEEKFPDPGGPENFAHKKWHLAVPNEKIPDRWPTARADIGN